MVAETLSSQAQLIFIPPAHFLNVIVQRGTITMFMPAACRCRRAHHARSDSTWACRHPHSGSFHHDRGSHSELLW